MQFIDVYEKILSYDFLDDDTKKHIYLEDGETHICRFCEKGENETVFDKSAHAISEMVGNRWLFSYRECKKCNIAFGNTCEDSFGKYVLPLKIVSQVFGKKRSIGYSNKHSQIKINKEEAIFPEFSEEIKALIKSKEDNSVLIPEKDGFTLELVRKPYIPQFVYFSLLKMALTILPFEEYEKYAHCYAMLYAVSRKEKKADGIKVCGFEEFIPGPERFKCTNVELYKVKDMSSNRPYMHFCLNFGNYSLQIPLPTDQQQKSITVIGCKHHAKSEIRTLRFKEFEEIFKCHFSAVVKKVVGEEKGRLAKCLNLEFQNRAE